MGSININVDYEEFKRKSPEDRDWMTFQAIRQINGSGCEYARSRWRKIYFLGTAAGAVGGFIAVATRWIIQRF